MTTVCQFGLLRLHIRVFKSDSADIQLLLCHYKMEITVTNKAWCEREAKWMERGRRDMWSLFTKANMSVTFYASPRSNEQRDSGLNPQWWATLTWLSDKKVTPAGVLCASEVVDGGKYSSL